jgi:hypothetical protein
VLPPAHLTPATRRALTCVAAGALAIGAVLTGSLSTTTPAGADSLARPVTRVLPPRPVPAGGRYTLHGSVRVGHRAVRHDLVRIYAERPRGRRLLGVAHTGSRGGFTFARRIQRSTLVVAHLTGTSDTLPAWTRPVWVRIERPLGERAVALAARLRGRPYAYGAAGPAAFDCSGLTMYVFARLGVRLPHNAEEQYQMVRHVPKSRIAVGDLVFFGAPGGIYHVGIYAGHHRIWHAPREGTVVSLQTIWTSDYEVGEVRQHPAP